MPEFEEVERSSKDHKPYRPSKEVPESVELVEKEEVISSPVSQAKPLEKAKADFVPGPIGGVSEEKVQEISKPQKKEAAEDGRPNMRSRWKRKGAQGGKVVPQRGSKVGAVDNVNEVKDALATRATQPQEAERQLASRKDDWRESKESSHQYVGGSKRDKLAHDVLPKNDNSAVSARQEKPRRFDAHLSQAMQTASNSNEAEENDMNKRYNNHRDHRGQQERRPRKQKGFFAKLIESIAAIFGGGSKKKYTPRGNRSGGGQRRGGQNRGRSSGGQNRSGGNRGPRQGGGSRQGGRHRSGGNRSRRPAQSE